MISQLVTHNLSQKFIHHYQYCTKTKMTHGVYCVSYFNIFIDGKKIANHIFIFNSYLLKYFYTNIRCRGEVIVDIGSPSGSAPPIIYITSHRSSKVRIPEGTKNIQFKK